MKTATIEILEEGETIFGSHTNGKYFVRDPKIVSPSSRISIVAVFMFTFMYR